MKTMLRKLKTLIRLTRDLLLSFIGTKNAHFLSAEETIQLCVEQKKSIIRFGDGEFNMLRGLDISYQRNHPELKRLLEATIKEYLNSLEKCPYILCMPGDFLKCSGFKLLKRQTYFRSWSPSRRYFNQHFDFPITYGDAFLFATEYQNIYPQIWTKSDISHIVFVNPSEAAFNEFNSTVSCRVSFVPIPSENAFSQMDNILDEIKKTIGSEAQATTMVLTSAGPCGKALVFALSMQGFRAIDTGHCFQNPLHKIV